MVFVEIVQGYVAWEFVNQGVQPGELTIIPFLLISLL
jgi:hypothetical protein